MTNNFAPSVDLSVLDPLIAEELLRDVADQAFGSRNAVAFVDIVNITDKGVLTGISESIGTCAGAGGYTGFRVHIDGVMFASTNLMYYDEIGDNNSWVFNHRFETSLQVEAQISVANDIVYFQVDYTTD